MPKRIRDPLYGFIELPNDVYRHVVDHPLVQRLRWVSQLPLEQLVYPAAQHSRFEHSLGVMHLARKAALCLIDSPNRQRFHALGKKDSNFSSLESTERIEVFVDCAGLAGLLHDVGHAPFSHTLEDACENFDAAPYAYDHERVGSILAEKVLQETNLFENIRGRIISRVLNKRLKDEELGALEILLRRIIDGPIDVDKGDYVCRDSYHCGVIYGKYDVDQLYDNIIINDRDLIGVKAKAALEAWSLRIARYKMFKNVYKHHIRNITDALLVELIRLSFINSSDDSDKMRDLIPVPSYEKFGLREQVNKFISWTDNTLLKSINDLNVPEITEKVEAFMSRNLYKRGFEINLTKNFPDYNEEDVHQKITLLKEQYKEKNVKFNYIIIKDAIPPVFERETQQDIRVQIHDGSNKFESLANHLGFGIDLETQSFASPDTILHIFIAKSDLGSKEQLKKDIENTLSEYSVQSSLEDNTLRTQSDIIVQN